MELALHLDDPLVPARHARFFLEWIGGLGIAREALLQGTQLDADTLVTPGARISSRQQMRLLENVVRSHAPEDVALESGRHFSIDAFGILGYAMMSCATLGQAVTIALRYYRTAGPLFELGFSVQHGEACIEVHDVLGLGALEPFVIEDLFANIPPLLRELLGESIQAVALELAYTAPGYSERYTEVFNCPVRFESDANRFRFDAALLERPLVRADAANLALFERSCREMLEAIDGSETLPSTIRRQLLSSPGAIPTADGMAAWLNLSTRTLRRRLAACETSYQALLDEVRCRLAIDYLQTTALSTQEIAELLGFTEATNFRRAFLRWTGHAPTAYRRAFSARGA